MKPKHPDAARVWQRVHPPEPKEQATVQMLMRQLSLDMAYLKRYTNGREDALIREYTRQLQSLKGILLLSGGHPPREAGSVAEHSLSRCYDHAMQRLAAYQLHSADPVYGPVFRDLARQTEHHCVRITQLLGEK